MAVARKTPTGKAKPAVIEAKATTVSVSAPVAADPVIPALQETLDATLNKAEEMQEHVRRTAEQSVEKTKVIYEKLKAAAEEATSSVETSLSTISKGVNDINMKALDAIKVNSDAQFAFVKALLATKTIAEAITLQGEHAKTQFETMNTQAKEFAALIQQVSTDSVEPIKATLTKSLQVSA
ncbi:MAG: phasin protein [Hyphomicrobiales bacterium]|jgi:phasin|nr:phasin protein [Hyphomicrobiales bacterium]